MPKYTYPHVEDYIEIIAGYKSPDGKNKQNIFLTPEPAINLARYDVKVVESFAQQSQNNTGFTDKQAALATALVVKYERQLTKLDVDITPVKDRPEYRIPIRAIDRTSRVWVENDIICIRFPFNNEMIETVRAESKVSQGNIHWEHEKKYWVADLTEHNVNWVYTFAQSHNFEIDKSLSDLMNKLLAVESQPYKIELTYSNDQVGITNAPTTLLEYVEENLGGLNPDNLLPLVDNAPILGYTIDRMIEETVIEAYGTRFYSLCANNELKCNPLTSNNLVNDIVQYARATNRFPIYIYEPDLSNRLKTEFNKYFVGQMMTLDNKVMDTGITDEIKVVYTTKIPRTPMTGRIPLLVSSAGMLFGGDRQIWVQNAEKVVYFTTDVYNKNKDKGHTVCKLD
jgi:hypothetical protein